MRVDVFMADGYASGWHRLGFPAAQLAQHGVVTRTVAPFVDADADVVVVQRPVGADIADFVEYAVAEGTAVVVDMDDDLSRIPDTNPARRMLDPALSSENWENAARACRAATLVTVATPALAHVYGAHGRVRVLENCVGQDWLDTPRADAAWVAWPGSAFSHADNLALLAPLARSLSDAEITLHVAGPAEGVVEAIGVRLPVASTGPVPFGDGWREAVSRIGVGLAPLAASLFNESKSWLRPLQMAAAGVPFVASAVGEYERLGAGMLAKDPEDWPAAVMRLVRSQRARDELSAHGRIVAADWTYEKRAPRWLEAWAEAHDIARSHV